MKRRQVIDHGRFFTLGVEQNRVPRVSLFRYVG